MDRRTQEQDGAPEGAPSSSGRRRRGGRALPLLGAPALIAGVLAAVVLAGGGGDDPRRAPRERARDGTGTAPSTPGVPVGGLTGTAPATVPGRPPPPPARGRERLVVGIGDQNAAALEAPALRALGLRHARFVVPYDAMAVDFERPLVANWLAAAERTRIEPFVTFGHSRQRPDRLPSVAEYERAVRAFRREHPEVRTFAPWNEINHRSQPTHRDPERAAAFHDALVRLCRDCTIVAGDLLDQEGMARYLARYRDALREPARRWGLHNYSDTNRFRDTGTRAFLRAVDGEVWLTETGGVHRFGRSFPADGRRQARAVEWTLRLARREPRITRIYLYNWTGADADARFDAGLTDAAGRPRPAYHTLRRLLR